MNKYLLLGVINYNLIDYAYIYMHSCTYTYTSLPILQVSLLRDGKEIPVELAERIQCSKERAEAPVPQTVPRDMIETENLNVKVDCSIVFAGHVLHCLCERYSCFIVSS